MYTCINPCNMNIHYLYFFTALADSSVKGGQFNLSYLLTSPVAWKGLPYRSSDSNLRVEKEKGSTTNSLHDADRYLRVVWFLPPKARGNSRSLLQSSFNCTSDLNWVKV